MVIESKEYPTVKQERILVVDDEQPILDLVEDFLCREGFQVKTTNSPQNALEELKSQTYALVLSDLKMPDMTGIDLLRRTKEIDRNIITIIMTGFGTLETAVKAMKEGAYDYVLKPFKPDQVVSLIQRGLETKRLREENLRMRETLSLYNMSEAIGQTLQQNLILDLTLETTYAAIEADFVNVLMREATDQNFTEVGHRTAAKVDNGFLTGGRITDKLLDHHLRRQQVLFDRESCNDFFGPEICKDNRIHSFLSVPLQIQGELLGMINALNLAGKHRFTEGQRKTIALIANRTGGSLENAKLFTNLEETLHQTIEGLAKAIEAKDRYTHGHSARVREYAMMIAKHLRMDIEFVEAIGKAAMLHDIGKIGVDLTYINKPGSLTREQIDKFRTHPEIGKDILSPIVSLGDIVPMVYHHHERFDGSGYPDGLVGEEIPIGARILAIADSYDAMTSDRAYRKALHYQEAIAEIKRGAGKQFDPKIVNLFVEIIEQRVANGKKPYLRPKIK